ncbi:MAG: hypothetical protein IT365_10180 [Candidatus Hydrogenedentes bacterium]|nr:hypothetical protein [Candidatus Hydrogenedentota bacterium]
MSAVTFCQRRRLRGPAFLAVAIGAFGFALPILAQSLRTEENMRDAIQGRETFSDQEQDLLDINNDGKIDVADMVTLLKDINTPVALFSAPATVVREGDGTVNIEITMTKQFTGTLDVAVSGTAASGADFTLGAQSITVNGITATLPLNITDDTEVEPIEFIDITLLTGQGYVPAGGVHSVRLRDNDNVWIGNLEFQGARFGISMELIRQGGTFVSGRVLSPGTTIFEGTPDERTISATTFPIEDGGYALTLTGTTAAVFKAVTEDFSIDMPIDENTTVEFLRRFEFESDPNRVLGPDEAADVYQPDAMIAGIMRDITEPPPASKSLEHLGHVSTGTFTLMPLLQVPVIEPVLSPETK